MQGVGLPAVAPQRSSSEQTVELDRFAGLRLGVLEAVGEACSFHWPLGVALDLFGRLDPETFVHRRDQIGAVVVLIACLTPGRNAAGPVHNQRIAHSPFPCPRLEHLERSVERHGPAGWVVVERSG